MWRDAERTGGAAGPVPREQGFGKPGAFATGVFLPRRAAKPGVSAGAETRLIAGRRRTARDIAADHWP
jgi:hypothetical protein